MNKVFVRAISSCLSFYLCFGCPNSKPKLLSSPTKTPQAQALFSDTIISNDLKKTKLLGIPLHCRLTQTQITKEKNEKNLDLSDIAEVYIKTNQYEQALIVVRSIKDDNDLKDNTLMLIANKFIEIENYTTALSIVQTLEQPYRKSIVLVSVASRYAKSNQYKKAIFIAQSIELKDFRASALAAIAVEYSKHRKEAQASELFSKALEITNSITSDPFSSTGESKDRALSNISIAYAQIRKYQQASQIINAINQPITKISTLYKVAIEYSKDNQRYRAAEILFQALENSMSVPDYHSKTQVPAFLSLIASEYARINFHDQAVQVAQSQESDIWKAHTLINISDVYLKKGESEKNVEVLLQALEISKTIKNSSWKSIILIDIAAKYIAAGQKIKGNEILLQALQIIKTVTESDVKISALSRITEIYAIAGHYEQALQISKMIEDTQKKNKLIGLLECAKREP